jgi:hypothetical protein
MGTKLDMKRRTTQLRVDDAHRRRHVNEARALIFESGAAVDGARVKAILNNESYVPVRVSVISFSYVLNSTLMKLNRTHSLLSCRHSTSIFSLCLSLTFYTSLNSAYGRPFLFTSCASSMLQVVMLSKT